MLKVFRFLQGLSFGKLMCVYEESNTLNGAERYPGQSCNIQIREAELDFYQYLSDVFFKQDCSFYCVWIEADVYVSALRIEPYLDGYLLCALETAPLARHKGYASQLIAAVIQYLAEQGSGRLYSHVSKQNVASLKTHFQCGFQIRKDYAVYSDGSVHINSYTLLCECKKSET